MKDSVIYIDDEINNLKAVSRLFRNESFDFITFDSPTKALAAIDDIKPRVVISDKHMPEMDGIVFLRKVKQRQPDTIRMILTGYADLESAMAAINEGLVFLYIEKPWNDEELRSQVKSALDHHDTIGHLRNIVDILVDEIIENQENNKVMRKLAMAIYSQLSQPMQIISGYTQLLQVYLKPGDLPHSYLSNITSQFNNIEETIKKIKSLS